MAQIILEEKLDETFGWEDIAALQSLEREMYLQGDVRSEVIRQALDLLYSKGVINDVYEPSKLKLEWDAIEA